jgi:hypothetical protein
MKLMKNTLKIVRSVVKPNLCTCGLFAGLLSISGCMQPDRNGNDPAAPVVAASASMGSSTLSPASAAGRGTGGPVSRFYVGNWKSVSNVWQGMGDLRIDGQSGFRWHQCKTTYAEEGITPSRSGAVLALSPDSDCRLDDSPPTRILFVRVASQTSPCDVKVTAYASDADVQNDRPSAEGIYTRLHCELRR